MLLPEPTPAACSLSTTSVRTYSKDATSSTDKAEQATPCCNAGALVKSQLAYVVYLLIAAGLTLIFGCKAAKGKGTKGLEAASHKFPSV